MLNINLGPFAVQVSHLLILASMLVAAGVGHWAGRRQQVGIGNALIEMGWVALVSARIVFVAIWFDTYRAAPLSILDIRDGGFTAWAGLAAALLVAVRRGWQRAALRKPLILGLTAGALAWGLMSSVVSGAFGTLGTSGTSGIANRPLLPAVVLTTLAGAPTTLAALGKGQPMVVNLWASWCPPCRREMPVLAAGQRQETAVTFVFVNQGEDDATAQRYLSSSGLSIANVLLDSGTSLGRAVGSTALPTTLFYDANGRLVDTHLGALSTASLASKLNQLRTRTDLSTKE